MASAFIIGVISSLVKNTIIKGVDKIAQKSFDDIFEETQAEFEKRYQGLSRTDLNVFFKSDEAAKCFESSDENYDINLKCLSRILKRYVNLPKGMSAESFLKSFFDKFEYNAVQCPELQGKMLLTNLKKEDYKLNKILKVMPKNQEISDIHNALDLILNEVRQPQVDGKTLTGNLQDDIEFFEKCMQKLDENPYFNYNVHLIAGDGDPVIELNPKQPLKGSLTIKLNETDGKTLDLEEMLEDAYLKSGSILLNEDSIEEYSIYIGESKLTPSEFKFDHIELKPLPKKPVKLCIPGCNISYSIVLHRDKRNTTSIVLSNQYQNIPTKFRLELNSIQDGKIIPKGSGKLDLHLELERMDVIEGLQIFKFLKAIHEYRTLDIKSDEDKLIIRLESINLSNAKSITKEFIEMLKKLSFIQEKTSIRIPFPLAMSNEDSLSIEETFEYFKNGETELRLGSLNIGVPYENAKGIMENIGEDGVFKAEVSLEADLTSEFCGVKIPLGSARICCPSFRIDESVESLKLELEKPAKKTINFGLIPNSETVMLIKSER